MTDQASGLRPITIQGLSKHFPGQRALDDVSLTIEPGEVHALLGENGSGKSTLIKVLAGYHVPEPGGRIAVGEELLTFGSPKASHDAGIRFVHQHLAVVPDLDAVENVAMITGYARPGNVDWRAQERLTRELLARLGVTMDIRRPLAECKPVERTFVAIARALHGSAAGEVSLIVLDEPTSSLAAPDVAELFRVIRELTQQGVALLYVSHRLDEIFEIADRVSVLRDGRMVGTEPVAGLERERLVEMIIGRRPADPGLVVHAAAAVAERPPIFSMRGIAAGRLTSCTLDVRPGEIVGVVGITGSGREDVARAAIGGETATAGAIAIEGEVQLTWGPRQARDSGVLLTQSNTQAGSAIKDFDVRENMTIASLKRFRGLGGIRLRRERSEVVEWIERLDIRPVAPDRKYRLLSGGNQQKVILARSLGAGARLLILDEPAAGVDVGAREALYEFLLAQARDGLAVLLCSSDLEDIVRLCDRALIMGGGRVVDEVAGAQLDEGTLMLKAMGDHEMEMNR